MRIATDYILRRHVYNPADPLHPCSCDERNEDRDLPGVDWWVDHVIELSTGVPVDQMNHGGPHVAVFLEALGLDPRKFTCDIEVRHTGADLFKITLTRLTLAHELADAFTAAHALTQEQT